MDISGQSGCTPSHAVKEQECENSEEVLGKQKSTKGGWKTMPFILGNESCANLALTSLHANLVVYLTSQYNMERLTAANIATIWGGSNLVSPLIGAFIADSYLGRFGVIVLSSVAYTLAMSFLTLISFSHPLRESIIGNLLLYTFLGLMVLGSSGMKSSALAFGAEQFDNEDDGGRKQERFFDWYFCIGTISIMVGLTLLVHIQNNISWKLGFGLATILMTVSTGFFLLGSKHYVKMSPDGSPLREYAQVIVASFRKRNLVEPSNPKEFCDTNLEKGAVLSPCLTDKFNFLNKAAIITKEDFEENSSEPNPWKLCTVKRIQELKSVLSVFPVWSSGIVTSFMLMGSSHTYMIYQAQHMDRSLGSLEVAPSSYIIFSMLATSIWLPFYERVVLPFFRHLTERKEGILIMERIGTGLIISIQAMTVAALIEVKRKKSSKRISAFWLAPQYTLIGLAEAFYAIGMIEFFYEQFPMSMSSTAVALFWCSIGIGLLLNSAFFTIVYKVTGSMVKELGCLKTLIMATLSIITVFVLGLVFSISFIFLYAARL